MFRNRTGRVASYLIAGCAALLLACGSAVAQDVEIDPAALEKARRLVEVSEILSLQDEMHKVVRSQMEVAVLKLNPKKDSAVKKAIKDLVVPRIDEYLPRYLEYAAIVYARHFTAEELEQLIAFFGSPAGKKLFKQQPSIREEMTLVGREWFKQVSAEILKTTAADMKKRGLRTPDA